MADPTSLSTPIKAAETTNALINKFVVSPVLNLGIAGLEFDIFDEHKIEQQADITDHFVEDNTAISDHITLKPEKISLRGFVGEVVDTRADPKSSVQELTEKLTIINSYIPVVVGAAKQLNGLISANKDATTSKAAANSIGTGVDLFKAFKELNPPNTKQAKAYNFFVALFEAKQLVAVNSPYGFLSDMAIENVVAIQGDNKYISDFSITLKKINTVETKLVDFDSKKNQGRAGNQKSDTKDQGRANGETKDSSLLFDLGQSAGLIN